MMQLKESDIVLCTVERVDRTTVFVNIDDFNLQGTIITSEIAPGRIRNLRDYVSPGRKIACKVLRIEGNNIHLSLRRVIPKEKKEVMEKAERERNSLSILKTVLQERAIKVAEEIKKTSSVSDFLNHCKTDPKALGAHMSPSEAEKICKILSEKKEKQVEVKKAFALSSRKPNGLALIKEILEFCKGNCDVSYISAGNFAIKLKSSDYKKANSEISHALEKIEKTAKEKKLEFELSDK